MTPVELIKAWKSQAHDCDDRARLAAWQITARYSDYPDRFRAAETAAARTLKRCAKELEAAL